MAGNWKMYKTPQETATFFDHFKPLVHGYDRCDIVIFPSAIDIPAAVSATVGSNIAIGGQNIYWGKEGAFTGEISAEMLTAAGARWTLVEESVSLHLADGRAAIESQAL